MQKQSSPGSALTHHHELNDAEFVGRAPEDALSTEMAVANATATIRSLISEDRRTLRHSALPELKPQDEICAFEPLSTRSEPPLRRMRSRMRRLRRVRPTLRCIGWAMAFGMVLWQPAAVLIFLFIAFWAALICHAVVGPERMRDIRQRVLLRLSPAFGKIRLRRAPDADPFSDLIDPFDRLHPGTR